MVVDGNGSGKWEVVRKTIVKAKTFEAQAVNT